MTYNFEQEKYLKFVDHVFAIDYPEELKIIDFHTHLSLALPGGKAPRSTPKFPTIPRQNEMDLSLPYWTDKEALNKKYSRPFALFKVILEGVSIYKDMVSSGSEINILASMQSMGIYKSVVLPISTAKKDVTMGAIDSQNRYPESIIAFCSVHPKDSEAFVKIHKYHRLGAKGLKLKMTNDDIQRNFNRLIAVLTMCSALNMPVLFHTGTVSNLLDGRLSPVMNKFVNSTAIDILEQLLEACPDDLNFIFGHSGIAQYKKVARLMKKYPSSYAELSSQSTESIQYLIDEVGYNRLLFGSDWPALPQAITLSRVLQATENKPMARNHILYLNAEKLLYGKGD